MLVSDHVLAKIMLIPSRNLSQAALASILRDVELITADGDLVTAVKKYQPNIIVASLLTEQQLTELATLRKIQDRPLIVCIGAAFEASSDPFDFTIKFELLNTALLMHLFETQRQIATMKKKLVAQEHNRQKIELLKTAIVRNVSHELRTPLLQVKSAVALLGEDAENNTLVEYATNATARLEAVVNNITQLAFSQESRECAPVLMRECMQAALRNLGRSWEHKPTNATARIHTNIEPNLPPVWGDRQGISMVLQLILDNALKFSEDRVELTIQRQQDTVQTTIRDYGIGIAPDKIEDIFDTFYQIDSESTRRYGGAGVGLAIARLIMEHHNTAILVKSKEGHGSTFSFSLPVAHLEP